MAGSTPSLPPFSSSNGFFKNNHKNDKLKHEPPTGPTISKIGQVGAEIIFQSDSDREDSITDGSQDWFAFVKEDESSLEEDSFSEDEFSDYESYVPAVVSPWRNQSDEISPQALLDAAQHELDPVLAHALYDKAAFGFLKTGRKSEAFKARAQAAARARFSKSHPLYDMGEAIEKKIQAQANPDFGAHFSFLDTGTVKGGVIRAWKRKVNAEELYSFQFKLSSYARVELQKSLVAIKEDISAFSRALPESLQEKIQISRMDYLYRTKDDRGNFTDEQAYQHRGNAKAIQITFGDIGRVIIPDNPERLCLANEVIVELFAKEKASLDKLQQMCDLVGLGPVFYESREDDIKRRQMALVFRTYFPDIAYKLENSKEFYAMPLSELRVQLEEIHPDSKSVFKKYIDEQPELLQSVEIYPGRNSFAVTDISHQMRAAGAYGLMAGVGQNGIDNGIDTCIRLLSGEGAISTQDRLYAGILRKGSSPESDLELGGGDQVFTRLITDGFEETDIKDFAYCGTIQVLYDLDVLNRGGYGYEEDEYGSKEVDLYGCRKNLIDFTEQIVKQRKDTTVVQNINNEVMIKSRIGPEYIKGFIVQTVEQKNLLAAALRRRGIAIPGKSIDDFIHVATRFTKRMWN
jgi:hypothetical protein